MNPFLKRIILSAALIFVGTSIVVAATREDIVTSVTVGNATPTMSVSLSTTTNFHVIENSFAWATASVTISDTSGCGDIATTTMTAKLYIASTTNSGTVCAQNDNSCYIGFCTASSTNICTYGSDTDVIMDCAFKVWYIAEPTDAGSYWASSIWSVSATASDNQAATVTATNSAQTIEMITLLAHSFTDTITYTYQGGSVSVNSTSSNQITTAVTTGNTALDVNLSGIDMTDSPDSIAVGKQKYSSSHFNTWAGQGTALTTTQTEHELNNSNPTSTTSPVSGTIHWALEVPPGTPPGTYTGAASSTAIQGELTQ